MKEEVTVTLYPIEKNLVVKKGVPLIDVLHEYGVEFPCGARGTCGRCKIKLLKGYLQVDATQQKILEKLELGPEWRLACFCRADSDITIEVAQFEDIILADNTNFRFTPRTGFGIAVDLGTTTIVAQLLDLKTGSVLDVSADINPQSKFGADLISRVQSCIDGNQLQMQKLVQHKIGEMIRMVMKNHPVNVSRVIITGNTVMHHIFSGLDIRPLSSYPFESPNQGMQQFSGSELNWELPAEAEILFYPSIGSFVGSDILAGIAATNITRREKYSALIDLGTNGEIVVGNCEQVICASTAAGPAFEGAKISQGMRAVTGAISSVQFKNGTFVNHVIGNVPAKGICGSGLIDAMAVLLQQEEIGMFGEINSGEHAIKLASGVFLTQQDIREFQLAKAAVAAGMQILLNKAAITFDDIEHVYIAGGFGNFLNLQNVIQTGLIETTEDKLVKMGNTSLIGAKMFLFDDISLPQSLLKITRHVNLEGDSKFQDIYVEKMLLSK